MEQRTFLAIVISFLFLMSYNAFVIAPQHKNQSSAVNINTVENSAISKAKAPRIAEKTGESYKDYRVGSFILTIGERTGTVKRIFDTQFNYAPILENFIGLSNDTRLQNVVQDNDRIILSIQSDKVFWEQSIEAIGNNKLTVQIRPSEIVEAVQGFNVFTIDATETIGHPELSRDNMLFEYSFLSGNKVVRKNNAFKFNAKDNRQMGADVEWLGWRDRYHFTVVKPQFACQGFSSQAMGDHQMNVSMNNCSLGADKSYTFEVYMGPQDLDLLNSFGGSFHKIMAFSGNPILDFIEKLIYKFILALNKLTKNWGVSIILVSVIIYGITYPLTFKSMMSMKKMQELQPKMAELREKYKNDPQRLNNEVVQLYKVHNINPLGGCLPMLLQMPVFISLYQVLWRTHNFQNANFLWIKDLSKPDRAGLLNMHFPFIGNELNVLPIVMAIVMFFQQKLSSKNMVTSDPSQEMQQKMMTFLFPIFIGSIFYHFASGLTLYFTVFYLMSTLMQYQMSKIKK